MIQPEVPEGSEAAVYAIFNEAKFLQFVGFSKDLRNSLRTVFSRRPDKAFFYKCFPPLSPPPPFLLNFPISWLFSVVSSTSSDPPFVLNLPVSVLFLKCFPYLLHPALRTDATFLSQDLSQRASHTSHPPRFVLNLSVSVLSLKYVKHLLYPALCTQPFCFSTSFPVLPAPLSTRPLYLPVQEPLSFLPQLRGGFPAQFHPYCVGGVSRLIPAHWVH